MIFQRDFGQHVIARRLIAAMVLFSTLITLTTTSYQIYNAYQYDVKGIRDRLDEIRDVHLPSVISRVWKANHHDLGKELSSLLSLPDVTYLHVSEPNGVITSAGAKTENHRIERTYPLHYEYKNQIMELGQLEVHATLQGAYQRAIDQAISILLANGIKTFLVVGFVLIMFFHLVTRHLEKISKYTQNINLNEKQEPLRLARKTNHPQNYDELDRVVVSINDLQLRIKSSYEKIKESELRFRLLAENIAGVFWVGSPDWQHIYYISPAYEQVWGRSCESLYENPMSWLESVVPQDRKMVEEDIFKRANGAHSMPFFPEYRIKTPEGKIRWISARAFPIKDESGNIEKIVGLADEISLRKEAEIRLANSESRFRNLMESAADGIISIDSRGSIVMANSAAHEMFKYEPHELHNKPFSELIPKSILDQVFNIQEFWKLPEKCQTKKAGTTNGVSKDGTQFPINVQFAPLTTREGITVTAMIHDLTQLVNADHERAYLQKQLQQSQKMETLGQLTGGIAHDFNNLLTAILGYTKLAVSDIAENNIDAIREYLNEVEHAGFRARDLVKQMLTFSRNSDQELQQVDLCMIVKESMKMMRPTIPSSIVTNLSCPYGLPVIDGDTVQLHQVLVNLIVNARDAMSGKGTLSISLEHNNPFGGVCDSCHEKFDGEYVSIKVTNPGKGIAEDIKNKIFEPFYTTKETGKGSGMGLSMVHGIVHGHEGHIQVNTGGVDTSFKVYLPVSKAKIDRTKSKVHLSEEISENTHPSSAHIMVVDDERSVAHMLATFLKSSGYVVTPISDSISALRQFERDPYIFDLVITDQTMPGMTGFELAQHMLAIRNDLKIVMITGYSEYVDKNAAQDAGLKAFFQKPLELKSFLPELKRILTTSEVA